MNSIMKVVLVLLFTVTSKLALTTSPFAYPRLLILGPTGVGKSSLGNVLAGCQPNDESCFFPVCPGGNSCTKETKIAQGFYLGNGPNVTLIDTPGFGDTDGDEDVLLPEMVNVLKETLEEANVTILCFDYDNRFDTGIQKMILELEALFGRTRFWNNVILEVTKWAYDEVAIEKRNLQGITEESALLDINTNLQNMFHLNYSLPGVFIDSYAVFYPDDQVQQDYFTKYTHELWTFAEEKEAFSFFTIEDVLEDYLNCQIENDCLNGVIQEDIDELKKEFDSNKDHIDSIDFELRNEIKIVKQTTSSLNIQIGVARDLIYSNQDNINLNIDHINDLNLTLQNDISSLEDLKKTFQVEVTEFQCPATANKLGEKVCQLGDSLNGLQKDIDSINTALTNQNSQISKNSQDISANTKAISNLEIMDTNINSKITDLTGRLAQLEDKFTNQLAICSNSAQHSLGIDKDGIGRYVGNCNSGNIFTPSECRFECKDGVDSHINWVSCGTVECKGSGMWGITGHGCPCCLRSSSYGHILYNGCC